MKINAERWPRDPNWTCPNEVDDCPSAEWCRTHFHYRNFGLFTATPAPTVCPHCGK